MASGVWMRFLMQRQCSIDGCEKRYYKNLSFLELCDSPNATIKRKSLTQESAEAIGSYTVGYFQNGQMIRLDEFGPYNESETYILRKDGLCREAHTFLTKCWSSKAPIPPQKDYSYRYQYNEQGQICQIDQISYDCPFLCRIETRTQKNFIYDQAGLRQILAKCFVPGKAPESLIFYDCEREKALREATIFQKSQAFRGKKLADAPVDFVNRDNFGSKYCPHCGERLEYILTADLSAVNGAHPGRLITKLPVLFCQSCLSDQEYTLDELVLPPSPLVDNLPQALPTTFGGIPKWIQCEDHPDCPCCGKPMVFVMEVKSQERGLHPVMFGDCGSLYVFTCCEHVAVRMQCY